MRGEPMARWSGGRLVFVSETGYEARLEGRDVRDFARASVVRWLAHARKARKFLDVENLTRCLAAIDGLAVAP